MEDLNRMAPDWRDEAVDGHFPAEQNQIDREQPIQAPSFLTRLRHLWLTKTGIDWRTYKLMFQGAVAPTIATALS